MNLRLIAFGAQHSCQMPSHRPRLIPTAQQRKLGSIGDERKACQRGEEGPGLRCQLLGISLKSRKPSVRPCHCDLGINGWELRRSNFLHFPLILYEWTDVTWEGTLFQTNQQNEMLPLILGCQSGIPTFVSMAPLHSFYIQQCNAVMPVYSLPWDVKSNIMLSGGAKCMEFLKLLECLLPFTPRTFSSTVLHILLWMCFYTPLTHQVMVNTSLFKPLHSCPAESLTK